MCSPIHALIAWILGWTLTPPHLKLLQLAVLNGLPPSWTSPNLVGWRLLPAQNHLTGVDLGRPGAIHANGPGSAHRTPDVGVNSTLPLL